MEISLAPEIITTVFGFPITNTFLMTIVISLLIVISSFLLQRKIKIIPRGLQNLVEWTLEGLLDLMDGVTGSRHQTRQFFPIVATVFIFVLLSNWIEIVPGLGTIGVKHFHEGKEGIIPFIRSNSADLNMTLALSLVVVFLVQFMGIKALGAKKYSGKFLVSPFKKPYIIGTFVGLLEIISEFAKIISFSFRLFGNIFAGEVLLTVALVLVPYLLPLPFLFLEIFVGFIQALVFSMLTLVFMKMAAEEAH